MPPPVIPTLKLAVRTVRAVEQLVTVRRLRCGDDLSQALTITRSWSERIQFEVQQLTRIADQVLSSKAPA